MNFFLFSGPQNSGKTSAIREFTKYLISSQSYSIFHPIGYTIPVRGDISCILDKNGKKVLIVSETDQVGSIKALIDFYNQNVLIDVIITAARDEGDHMRNYLFNALSLNDPINYYFEIPLGRMVRGSQRGTALTWYENAVQEVAKKISTLHPFSL